MRPQNRSPRPDEHISRLAAAQHGVLTWWQLRERGVGEGAIKRRAKVGRLVRVYRGVYAAGHADLTLDGRRMAAVLACGPDSALSHRAATGAYALRPAWREWLEVSCNRGVRVPGVITHRVKTMEVTTLRGIPITTVARTLADLADVTNPRILRQVLDQAEILRLDAPIEIKNGRRGAGRLKEALAQLDPLPHVPRSELERRFLDLCPVPPVIGLVVEGYETDFAWPAQRLVVETDGWGTHSTKMAFGEDRRRDVMMRLAGWTVLRFTYRDVIHDPAYVTSTLARLLG